MNIETSIVCLKKIYFQVFVRPICRTFLVHIHPVKMHLNNNNLTTNTAMGDKRVFDVLLIPLFYEQHVSNTHQRIYKNIVSYIHMYIGLSGEHAIFAKCFL